MHWIKALFHKRQWEEQLDREMRFHIDEQTEELMAEGLSREEARRRVMLAFGGREFAKEQCRDEQRVRWVEDFLPGRSSASRIWQQMTIAATLLVLRERTSRRIFSS